MMFPRKGMNPTRFDTIVDVNEASTDVSGVVPLRGCK